MPHQIDAWTAEVRTQARVAVQVASQRRVAADRTLTYFLRRALAHGLTLAEVADAANLPASEILELTDPSVAA